MIHGGDRCRGYRLSLNKHLRLAYGNSIAIRSQDDKVSYMPNQGFSFADLRSFTEKYAAHLCLHSHRQAKAIQKYKDI